MSKEQSLVERLREMHTCQGIPGWVISKIQEAADRMEADAREIDTLRKQLAKAKEQRNKAIDKMGLRSGTMNAVLLELDNELAALERTGKHD